MKDFDLEKFDKKVPYSVPEKFFEEMQELVIQKTTLKSSKKTKVFHLFSSKTIGIAATVVLLVGLTFLWNKTKTEESSFENKSINVITSNQNNASTDLTNKDSQTLTYVEKTENQADGNEKKLVNHSKVKEEHDHFFSSLSDEELDAIMDITEQDIYLELYTNN